MTGGSKSQQIIVLKAGGEREYFDGEKLRHSLKRAGANPVVVDKIVHHIEKELISEMSTTDIYRHAFSLLQQHQKPVAARYSLRRALVGLGPTGFPFEDFVAEIFKSQGFQTETDKMILGKCVEHEMDVIAWNSDKLIMSEVKFHNELGMKSDLKVALYVKARFDDLKASSFFYGNKQRKLDEGWLITNTKFSERAVQYGECAGLTMIGWNYPKKGNLQDMIEAAHLHPVTCLTSLTGQQKQELFTHGIVLCKSLKDDPKVLQTLGLNQNKIDEVIEEIVSLY